MRTEKEIQEFKDLLFKTLEAVENKEGENEEFEKMVANLMLMFIGVEVI